MGLKFKRCADCNQMKMIGNSKRRCNACRKADPTKQIPSSPKKPKVKTTSRQTIGPFHNWQIKNLPKCVWPKNQHHSTIGLGKKQRLYVLKLNGFQSYIDYLNSNLWQSIRMRVLSISDTCVCGCGAQANQVHHKTYTEANLMGSTLRGLVPMNKNCHYEIEFSENGRKISLNQANYKLKQKYHEKNSII